jgi:hypothetical protein
MRPTWTPSRRVLRLDADSADVCWRMLTYAGLCWRMLMDETDMDTFKARLSADVCWRMLTYTGIWWFKARLCADCLFIRACVSCVLWIRARRRVYVPQYKPLYKSMCLVVRYFMRACVSCGRLQGASGTLSILSTPNTL